MYYKQTIKLLLFSILFSLVNSVHSQESFDSAVYKNQNGELIHGYVSNKVWKQNPSSFRFVKNMGDEEKVLSFNDVEELTITNKIKYIKHVGIIDQSSNQLSLLSNKPEPYYKLDTVFLEVLIEGSASLYVYKFGITERYFYSYNKNKIAPLEHKLYKKYDNKVAENNTYRAQLYQDIPLNDIENNSQFELLYDKNSLMNYFVLYNSKQNNSLDYNQPKKTIGDLIFIAELGFKASQIKMQSTIYDLNFGRTPLLNFGFNTEFNFTNFSNSSWSAVLFLDYSKYSESLTYQVQSSNFMNEITINYNALDVALGPRKYYNPNNTNLKGKIYLETALHIGYPINSQISFDGDLTNYSVSVPSSLLGSFIIGTGYISKHISLNLQYLYRYDILPKGAAWNVNLNTISLSFGYRFSNN